MRSKGAQRTTRSALGFDTLEDRSLLNHAWGPLTQNWQPSGGHGDPPAPTFAINFIQPAGLFSGSLNSWGQGQSFPASSSPVAGFGSGPEQAAPSPASPSGLSPQAAATPAVQPAAVPTEPARPVETATGTFAPRSSKPVTTDDSGAVLALGTGPGTTNALPPGISGDPIDGLVLQGGTGSAQAALFVTSTSDFAASLSPSTVAAGQITPGLQLRLVPLASSARIDSTSRPVEIVPAHLPAPRGADLITNSGLFRNWQFDGRLSRLFGDPREPFEPQSHGDSYLSWVALALVAFEAARRWRRRSTKKPRISQRFRHSLINGLHWNSP